MVKDSSKVWLGLEYFCNADDALWNKSDKEFTEMAMDDLSPGSLIYNNLSQVLKATNRAQWLVRQILTFSRQGEQERHPVIIQLVVHEALVLLKEMMPPNIEIVKSIDPDCGPVIADPTQIHQLVMNLCVNAYQAMQDKKGTLGVIVEEVELNADSATTNLNLKTGTYIRLSISDTGHGMDTQTREKIFDPFFTTKGPQSTGLGMSVSYGIVTRHQGAISVDSEEGKGTVFAIKFPVREVEKQETAAAPETGGDMQKAAILIIEDEEDVRSLLQDILTMQGHHVVIAQDGREGVALFKPGAFDLVFTDLGMPGMSGWEVAKAIRAQDPKVAIAIITGWDIHMEKDSLEESGVNLIIQKPFTVDAIVRLVREALAIKKG